MVNFVSWGQKCATCQTKGARREMAETREGREHRQLELSRSSQLGVSEAVSRGPCEQRGDRGPYNVRACKVRACEVKHESGCTRRRKERVWCATLWLVRSAAATHTGRWQVQTWRAHRSPSSPTMASRPSKDVRTASIPITSSMSSIAGCGPSSSVHVKTTACPIGQPCWFPL